MPTINGTFFGDYLNPDPGNHNANDPQYSIFGHEGDDEIHGGDNGDYIDGGTGADSMYGWGGNDTYVVDNAGDFVFEQELHGIFLGGTDQVNASVSFTLPDFVENLVLLAGAGGINGTGNGLANELWGNSSGNTLDGRDGNDEIFGLGGADTLLGGAGDDVLGGGTENDTLDGGANNDELGGGDGNDTLLGGSGNDTLRGGNHDDTLDGGENDDDLFGDAGYDILIGGTGRDTLDDGEEMRGGFGDDVYIVRTAGQTMSEAPDGGRDGVFSFVSLTLGANFEDLVLEETATAINGFGNASGNTISGNEFDNELRGFDGQDTLAGGDGNDVLRGGNHNDTLHGNEGDDDLRGDGGDDIMSGGIGNDTYAVGSLGDVVEEFLNEGFDTVNSSQLDSYTLPDHVEKLVLATGTNGTGNNLANTLVGNILNNMLDGRGGSDTMEGRLGDDTYVIDEFGDVVIETAGQGFDTVIATATGRLTPGAELEVLRTSNPNGTAAINLFGNEFANTITGNDGDNIISGGASADTMTGRLGNDTYQVDNAGDVVTELANQGVDKIVTSISLSALAANVENLTMTGAASINANGNGLGNVMLGNSGRNTLDGGGADDEIHGGDENDFLFGGANDDTLFGDGGVDRLVGSSGADEMAGGAGADTFEFRAASDSGFAGASADEITDFSAAQGDRIDLAQIDANSLAADDQAFSFIGNNNPFSGVAGQLRFNAGQLEGDLNGDATADFRIQVNVGSLVAADFVL
jgi:Ca2+-binding RTX toxin-like protein